MAMVGHYPEDRSDNKGNEPEGAEFGRFGPDRFLFVGSERSSVVTVYTLDKRNLPTFHQVLPAGLGPEGVLAIPQRDLLVASSENDSREDKFRATVSIYQLADQEPDYPTVSSDLRDDGSPIPWAALSALAADPDDATKGWTLYDSYFKESRIFPLDFSAAPALITGEIVLDDSAEAFKDAADARADGENLPEYEPENLYNEDGTVNLDPEGLARRADGGFWVASEGDGTAGEANRPITSFNWLLKVADDGEIEEVVSLPAETDARQVRFGFEGVASVGSGDDEVVYVCFQREWADDPDGCARIGRYATATGEWTFYYYPLDEPESPNGGWVGLSEIVAVGGEDFLVVERDDQAGPDARVKRIYAFSVSGLTPLPEADPGEEPAFPKVEKALVRDLMPDLEAPNGLVIEKVEGLAVLADGDAVIVTDNDGVEDNTGETQLINIGPLVE
jgi:hypothetical protein